MSGPTRKSFVRLAREERVGAILAAAEAVFTERGYEAAAVSEIAERAGVVEGTIYKYFHSKRELLVKVIEQWYEGMVEGYSRDLPGVHGTRERLRFVIWRHLRAVRDYPQLCRLMFSEVRSEQDYYELDLLGRVRRYSQFVTDVIEEGVRSGEFRGDIPLPLLRDLVFGCIEHRTWNYISGRGELDIDATADQIMTVLCDGIGVGQAGSAGDSELRRETRRLAALADRFEAMLAAERDSQ